ncbi:response regulator [Nitrospira sp. Nam74]
MKHQRNILYSTARRYALACGAVSCTFLLSLYVDPVQHRLTLFLLLFAVVGTTWYGGVKPGIAALIVAAACATSGLIGTANSSIIAAPHDVMRLVFFIGVSIFAILLLERHRTMVRELRHRTQALEAESSERRYAERLRSESEARYQKLFEENPVPTCLIDDETLQYLAVNEAAVRHYGYTAEEFLSMTPKDIRPAEEVPAFLQAMKDTERMESGNCGIWRHRKRDGTIIHVEVTIHRTSFRGRPARLVVYQDVSAHVRAEAMMQTVNYRLEHEVQERTRRLREKQDQLRSIASQLTLAEDRERKRLAGVLHDNLSQLLVVSKMKLERMSLQHSFEKSWNTLMDVKRMLDDALTYSRTLTAELRPALMGTEDDLDAALKWVAEKMHGHGLMVNIRHYGTAQVLDEDVLIVSYQAVQELLWNVLKHAGVFEAFVSTDCTANHIEIVVQDYGKGFDASRTAQPSKEGGFGLLNVAERLDTVGGELKMTSMPGSGTRAILRLPVKGAAMLAPACAGDEARTDLRKDGTATRILLVEDHQVTRQGLRDAIEEQPDMIVVAEATNGERAIELARNTWPDVVIMDIHLPGDSGVDVTRAIKRECPTAVVIGFSMDESGDMVQGLCGAGAAGCVSKAGPLEGLFAAIRMKGRADIAEKLE